MTAITDAGNDWLRDYTTAGVPASGANEPSKSAGRAVIGLIDAALASLGVNGAITVKKATRALLLVDLAHAADTLAVVYGDAADNNNGIYVKSGASGSGSWSKTSIALPAEFATEIASALSQLEGLEGSVTAAADSASAAAGSATTANTRKQEAEAARDVALSLLPVGAAADSYATKAALDAAVSGLADGAYLVLADEDNEGAPALYKVATGAVSGSPAVFRRRDALLPDAPQNYVGADDGSTDNLTPFTSLLAANPSPTSLRVPYLDTGVYDFSGFDNTNTMDGYTLVLDRGVTFSAPAGQWLQQPGLKVTQPLTFEVTGTGGYTFTYGPAANRTPEEKARWLDHGSADWRTTEALDCTADVDSWKLAWPSTLTAISPDSEAADHVGFTIDEGGTLFGATTKCLPGEEVSCVVTNLTTTSPVGFLILLEGGVFATYQAQAAGNAINWNNSVTAAGAGQTYTGYNHLSYIAHKSVLGVRVLGPRSFQLLYNGYEVLRVDDAGANVLDVGFACGFNTDGDVRFTDWTRVKGKKLANLPLTRVLVVGDSRADDSIVGYWSQFFEEAADGMAGLRVQSVTNIANSGDQISNQLVAVQGLTLSNYDAALIDVGTNNVQSGTALATSLLDFETLLDELDGKWVVVAIPSLFYGRAQTPSGTAGADATNYAEGAALRQATKALCAGRSRVKVIEYDELGPIIGDLLDLGIDPTMFDNLHPTFKARMTMGYAMAKALLGLMSPEPVKTYPPSPFHSSWYAADYAARASNDPSYEIDPDGRVTLSGWLDLPASLPAAGTTMVTLPRMLWPEREVEALCPCYDNSATPAYLGVCPVRVTTAGLVVNAHTFPVGTVYVRLDPLTWMLG